MTSSSYPLNLPRYFLSTPRHPLTVTPECPGYSLTSTEVYPVYPDYPLKYPEKPMSALRTLWHSLTVTWWSYIHTDIPYWYGNFFFKDDSKEVEILSLRSPERPTEAIEKSTFKTTCCKIVTKRNGKRSHSN